MNRTQLIRSTAAIASIALLTTGCGRIVEKATEKAVEEVVEQAVEADSGGDVEIDFTDDGISVESDEGDFTLTADEDGVQIEGTDADGNDISIDADEGGINVDTEDGSGSLDIDEDGSFTVTDEDGEVVTGNVDADGNTVDFTVEGEDGEAVFSTSEGIPEQWPSDIPEPGGLSEVTGTFFSEGDDTTIVTSGTTSENGPDFFESYVDKVLDAGFEEVSRFTQGDDASAQFTRGDESLSITVSSVSDGAEVTIALT